MDFFLAPRTFSVTFRNIDSVCSVRRTLIGKLKGSKTHMHKSRQLIVSIRDQNVNHIYTGEQTHLGTVFTNEQKNALMLADLIEESTPQTKCDIAEMISLGCDNWYGASTPEVTMGKIIQLSCIWWQKMLSLWIEYMKRREEIWKILWSSKKSDVDMWN